MVFMHGVLGGGTQQDRGASPYTAYTGYCVINTEESEAVFAAVQDELRPTQQGKYKATFCTVSSYVYVRPRDERWGGMWERQAGSDVTAAVFCAPLTQQQQLYRPGLRR